MFLTKRKNGTYYIVYLVNKKRKQASTNTKNKTEAKYIMRNFKPVEAPKIPYKPLTLRQFMNDYLIYSEATHTPLTYRDYKQTFKYFVNYFGWTYDVKTLTGFKIQEYINHRIKISSKSQGRKDLINLKAAFNKMKSWEIIENNPCANIKRIRMPEKLPRFLTHEESEKLLREIDIQDIKDIVVVALETGMRQGELTTLKWEEANLESKTITLTNRVYQNKSKRVRSIPMTDKVYDILQRRSFYRRTQCFHSPADPLSKTLCKGDLRNTFSPLS